MRDDASNTEMAAAILAGGKARRYGGVAKGLLEAAPGVTIVEKQVAELASAGVSEVVIVANAPEPYEALGLTVIPDLRSDAGPLAGIEAALSHYAEEHDATLFLPCDLPGITAREIRCLEDAFRGNSAPVAVAVTEGSFLQPLCVVVHNGLREVISQAIDDGERSPRKLWEGLGATLVQFRAPAPFFNVNTPEDLARWRAEDGAGCFACGPST